jgi:hypothetical protein
MTLDELDRLNIGDVVYYTNGTQDDNIILFTYMGTEDGLCTWVYGRDGHPLKEPHTWCMQYLVMDCLEAWFKILNLQ